MKKLFKRNQIIITALALMIAIAGYINYKDNLKKEDAKAVSSQLHIDEVADGEIISNDVDPDPASLMDPGYEANLEDADLAEMDYTDTDYLPGEAVFTSGENMISSDVIVNAKLSREQVRATNKETLLNIINNESLESAEKELAIVQMIHLTEISEREAAAELILEAKGYTDCIVTITDEQADVVINASQLSDTQRVQIEDIVKRKANVEAGNITILSVAN